MFDPEISSDLTIRFNGEHVQHNYYDLLNLTTVSSDGSIRHEIQSFP